MDKNTQELLNAGNDILKSVTKAIDTNDYSKLASEITRTVKSVSVERKTTYASGTNQDRTVHIVRNNGANVVHTFPFLAKRISKYNGLVEGILGTSIGFCFFWAFFGCLFSQILPLIITMLAISIIGGVLGFSGFKKFKLAKEMHKYGNILKNAEYFKVSDLASAALESDEQVYKNLKSMVSLGYLPRGKFDASNSTFMITDAAYQMYLGAEQDRLAREERNAKAAEVTRQAPAKAPDKVQSLLDEGREYITFVRQINDVIPDTEEMSSKLYKLESIMNKIFEQVKKEPDTADDLHKLMNYYLPTIKKLLAAYVELDKQAGNGENVQQTKREIETVMDTINDAFEKLLDSLFQDMAWDISSDISVMKTMMAQDGLTDDGLQVATTGGGMAMAQAQEGGIALEFDQK
ncbi:5-bromo-4-chloroindolyl phosphate hydrolysis family protein [Butyrivibrio sp. VCB2006]|uniref:5-bromo-4-chloroindolyl phosphate hydrolysis family protein n=1 Tax=Butyrivibrio sp. VCB2006 TaxID=1280679 RepID=UPI0004186933|nr:5-bromo-4-chloroindolyl phosphate hydrolysis family protein [Butyrivibrio sp. VCB2006]